MAGLCALRTGCTCMAGAYPHAGLHSNDWLAYRTCWLAQGAPMRPASACWALGPLGWVAACRRCPWRSLARGAASAPATASAAPSNQTISRLGAGEPLQLVLHCRCPRPLPGASMMCCWLPVSLCSWCCTAAVHACLAGMMCCWLLVSLQPVLHCHCLRLLPGTICCWLLVSLQPPLMILHGCCLALVVASAAEATVAIHMPQGLLLACCFLGRQHNALPRFMHRCKRPSFFVGAHHSAGATMQWASWAAAASPNPTSRLPAGWRLASAGCAL